MYTICRHGISGSLDDMSSDLLSYCWISFFLLLLQNTPTVAVCVGGDVRLVDGNSYYEGRVEICHGGIWGTVCGYGINNAAANILCTQLGLPLHDPKLVIEYSGGTVPIVLEGVYCVGNENNLLECDHDGFKLQQDCIHFDTVGVSCAPPCYESAVRLLRNRVQICHNKVWGYVCADHDWTRNDNGAVVVCRELRFPAEGAKGRHYLIDPFFPYFLRNVNCRGSEEHLNDCSHSVLENVSCSTSFVAEAFCAETVYHCNETGAVRLTHSDEHTLGRLEVCSNGYWGSVCSIGAKNDIAAVVCRQLGHAGNGCQVFALYKYDGIIILPKIPILLENVTCRGNETSLLQCSHNGINNHVCYHNEDIIIECRAWECNETDIRLVDGRTTLDGRVEICFNGLWGSVCGNKWDYRDAAVVCRQLGYSGTSYALHKYGGGQNVSFHLDEVACTGNEMKLIDCMQGVGMYNCRSGVDEAGVICTDTTCVEGTVRLVDGPNMKEGRVQMCYNGKWYSVCGDKWSEMGNEADVVCSTLDYSIELVSVKIDLDKDASPILPSDIHCNGDEVILVNCSFTEYDPMECQQVAGVICEAPCLSNNVTDCNECNTPADCHPIPNSYCYCNAECFTSGECCPDVGFLQNCFTDCEDGDVRLQDGTDPSNGRVEICHYGIWRSLCSNHWSQNDAVVVCRQLGYHSKVAETSDVFRPGRLVLLWDIHCIGTEKELSLCPNTSIGSQSCDKSYSAGVICTRDFGNDPKSDFGSRVVGAVVGILVPVGAVIVTVVLIYLFLKWKHRQRVQTLQIDIFSQPVNTNSIARNGRAPEVMEMSSHLMDSHLMDKKKHFNPYGVPSLPDGGLQVSQFGVIDDAVHQPRTRMSSCCRRELSYGKFIIKCEQLTQLENIGQGEFGIVYRGKFTPHESSNQEVAIKTLKGYFDQLEVDKLVEESLKMSRFKHAHVMGLIGVCLDAGPAPYIVMPYMANGSLLHYLKRERGNLVLTENADEDEVLEVRKRLMVMCSQIASGMEYLAKEKYVHRDLAARNCMIDSHFLIKITDFGLSEDVFLRNYYREGSDGEMVKLPVKWMAPESLSDGHFSEKSDVWSYGVTMWEIFSGGKTPYPGTDPVTLIQKLEEGDRMPKPNNDACTEEIYEMMRKCWEMAPGDRPTFKEFYKNTSKYIEHIAGYLGLGYNPFAGPRKVSSIVNEQTDKDEKEVDEDTI